MTKPGAAVHDQERRPGPSPTLRYQTLPPGTSMCPSLAMLPVLSLAGGGPPRERSEAQSEGAAGPPGTLPLSSVIVIAPVSPARAAGTGRRAASRPTARGRRHPLTGGRDRDRQMPGGVVAHLPANLHAPVHDPRRSMRTSGGSVSRSTFAAPTSVRGEGCRRRLSRAARSGTSPERGRAEAVMPVPAHRQRASVLLAEPLCRDDRATLVGHDECDAGDLVEMRAHAKGRTRAVGHRSGRRGSTGAA